MVGFSVKNPFLELRTTCIYIIIFLYELEEKMCIEGEGGGRRGKLTKHKNTVLNNGILNHYSIFCICYRSIKKKKNASLLHIIQSCFNIFVQPFLIFVQMSFPKLYVSCAFLRSFVNNNKSFQKRETPPTVHPYSSKIRMNVSRVCNL